MVSVWDFHWHPNSLTHTTPPPTHAGAAFVVTRAGKYVFHGEAGYSDIETLTGFRTNTICRLLSMSKVCACFG